jgi:hypothetical protein
MTYRALRIRCAQKTVQVSTFVLPDGTLEEFQIAVPYQSPHERERHPEPREGSRDSV